MRRFARILFVLFIWAASMAPAPAHAATYCTTPLRLYEHINGGGRQVAVSATGFWINLTDYGFNDQVSSFRTGDCHVLLAEHIWGGGEWFHGGWIAPNATAPWVGDSWNDRISSVYIYGTRVV